MNPSNRNLVFGIALVFSVHSYVKDLYKKYSVQSSIISTSELMKIHTDILTSVIVKYVNRVDQEIIEEFYKEQIRFINSLISK